MSAIIKKGVPMKPYKIIQSKVSVGPKMKLIGRLKQPKVPLVFFKNVHTPPKAEIVKAFEAGHLPDRSWLSQP